MTGEAAESRSGGHVYSVVEFEGGPCRLVRRVVTPFPDAHTADLFALKNGCEDYSVAPAFFPEGSTRVAG